MGFWRGFWAALAGRVDDTCFENRHDEVLSDIQADVAATRQAANSLFHRFDQLMKELQFMGAREDAAFADLSAKIDTVKEGWAVLVASNAAKDTRIAELESALADADATAAANLATALDADSDADAAKVESAAAALDDLVAPPAEPAPVEPAAPEGDDVPPAA